MRSRPARAGDRSYVAIGIAGSGRLGTIALQECDGRAAGAIRRSRTAEFERFQKPGRAAIGGSRLHKAVVRPVKPSGSGRTRWALDRDAPVVAELPGWPGCAQNRPAAYVDAVPGSAVPSAEVPLGPRSVGRDDRNVARMEASCRPL